MIRPRRAFRTSRAGRAFLTVAAIGLLATAVPAAAHTTTSSSCARPASGYDTTIRRFVPFTNRFGERIAVDLYLPTDAAGRVLTDLPMRCRFPVVLESSPYRDWTTPQPTKPSDDTRREFWVQRGYVYAFADVPGSGGSDGSWCMFCRHEQLSGVDMVEALGTQRWSNGNVGMIGGSYPAINALLVAQHQPPHLKALIVAQFLTDLYDDFLFPGGSRRGEDALAIDGSFTYIDATTGQYNPPGSADDAERMAAVLARRAIQPQPNFVGMQDAHPNRDAWYAERSVHLDRVNVPVYLVGGWNDIFSKSTWAAYDRIGSQVKVLRQGPFTHVPLFVQGNVWPCASHESDYCGAPLFDRFLRGVHHSAYDRLVARPVKYYVEPDGASGNPADVAHAYVESAGKPQTKPWTMPLAARPEPPAVIRPDPTAGATGGRWFLRGSVPGGQAPYDYYLGVDGPDDQRAEEAKLLSVATPALASDTTLVGRVHLSLLVTADGPDADISVRLVDEAPPGDAVFPAGFNYRMGGGWLQLSHRSGNQPDRVRPMPVGQPVRIELDLWPVGYRFAKGHRIRLDLAPADTPRFVPLAAQATLSVDLAASRVTFPVAP